MKLLNTVLVFTILLSSNHVLSQNNIENSPLEKVYKITGNDSLKAFIFYPQGTEPSEDKPAVVIFHGGGWAIGTPSWTFGLSKSFAKHGIVGISAEYSLSDQKRITPIDAMEDACDLLLWLKKNSKELRLKPDSLAAYGWSAGGHLAACTAVFPKFDTVNNISSSPSALIFYTSALSVVNDSWFKQLLIGKGTPYEYSPAEHLRENIPPSIIIAAKNDSCTPVQESKLFHENMIKYNNESYLHIYENVAHLLAPSEKDLKPDKEVQEQAFKEINLFLEELGYIK